MIIASIILTTLIVTIISWPTLEDFFYTGKHRATPREY